MVMLGNSYIFQQDMDATVAALFDSAGKSPNVVRLTSGGLTLADHALRAQTEGSEWHAALNVQDASWDWVLLQDQSQIPGLPTHNTYWQASLEGALTLNTLAEARSAETVFMMTWGRRDGDSSNAALYPDFLAMQERLEAGYLSYVEATSTDARPTWVAPVGLAFEHIHTSLTADGMDPLQSDGLFAQLYSNDGSHPSAAGSYLAACVIYATISGHSPIGLAAVDGVDNATTLALQQAAEATVFSETAHIRYPWSAAPDSGEQNTDTGRAGDSDTPAGQGAVTAEEAHRCSCNKSPLAMLLILGVFGWRRNTP